MQLNTLRINSIQQRGSTRGDWLLVKRVLYIQFGFFYHQRFLCVKHGFSWTTFPSWESVINGAGHRKIPQFSIEIPPTKKISLIIMQWELKMTFFRVWAQFTWIHWMGNGAFRLRHKFYFFKNVKNSRENSTKLNDSKQF